MAIDTTYQPKVYRKAGGDEQVIASGGLQTIQSGGKVVAESGGIIDGSAAAGGILFAAGEVEAADLATDAVESAKIKDVNVTAAKLATDAVETAKIKAAAVTQAKLEEGSMVFVDKQLTDANAKALATGSGIELIAAPGANKAIVVHKVLFVADAVAGAWVEPSAPDDLVVQYNGGADITGAIEAGVMVAADISVRTYGVLDTELTPETNVAVNLFNTGSNWTGGNAANTLSVRVWYSIADTVAFS